MNNVCEGVQHEEFYLFFMEPMQHIKIISYLYPRNLIVVCNELGVNPLKNYCFKRNRVPVVRFVMEV